MGSTENDTDQELAAVVRSVRDARRRAAPDVDGWLPAIEIRPDVDAATEVMLRAHLGGLPTPRPGTEPTTSPQ